MTHYVPQADRSRAEALGLDPEDPRYINQDASFGIGEERCPWCRAHGTARPRLLCDIQQAEYALMDARTAAKCYRCHEPFTGIKHTLCGVCEARDKKEAKRYQRHGNTFQSRSLRLADGHGCVEAVSFAERDLYPEWFAK